MAYLFCSSTITALSFALLIWTSTASACAAQTSATSRANGEIATTLPELVAGIIPRCEGIVYTTEQNSEVFAFYRNTQLTEIKPQAFLMLLRRPSDTVITRGSWDDFFQIRTRNDPTGRWRRLQEYLEANLANTTIFYVSRDEPYDVQYDLYAVGIFNGKTVVGVQMFGVAT